MINHGGSKGGDYLKRLSPKYYQGQAYVRWSLTMHDRRQGWLQPVFFYKFRELLTHTMFRYGLCCPIFCCMPDHIHLLWLGVADGSDQQLAMQHLRTRINEVLQVYDCRLQDQAYDHVLKEEERLENGLDAVVDYIARNPERAGLVEMEEYASYPYTSCLIPGYPELKLFSDDNWPRFWRSYSFLKTRGLLRLRS